MNTAASTTSALSQRGRATTMMTFRAIAGAQRRGAVATPLAMASGRRAGRAAVPAGGRASRRRVASPKPVEVMTGNNQGSKSSSESSESSVLKLNIQGRHLKVTESLRRYVEDQVERATTHFMLHHHDVNKGKNAPISRVDVRLSTRGGPKHQTKGPQLQKAEVTVFTSIGVVRAEVESDNAYNAIDEAGRTTERKLRKLKEKAIAKGVWNGHGVRPKHKKKNKKDQMLDKEVFFSHELELELEAGAATEEPEEMAAQWESFVEDNMGAQSVSQNYQDLSIFRNKEVDLIPMTIADAVESLQFLGHDFFMFLDKEEGEIKVVYKRDVAGYGVLTPRFPPK